MNDFILYLSTAIALMFVIEGLLYALFPGPMREMMKTVLSLPASQIRLFGLIMASIGFVIVWLLRTFIA